MSVVAAVGGLGGRVAAVGRDMPFADLLALISVLAWRCALNALAGHPSAAMDTGGRTTPCAQIVHKDDNEVPTVGANTGLRFAGTEADGERERAFCSPGAERASRSWPFDRTARAHSAPPPGQRAWCTQ
jgi:hypothetical protein